MPYVATRPDPLTVVLDLRNVAADSLGGDRQARSDRARSPAWSVESVESMGAPVSRVRISLSQPLAHHVRSERNTVVVDFDGSDKGPPFVMPPASRQSDQNAPRIETPAVDPIAALGLGLAEQAAPAQSPTSAAASPAVARPSTTSGRRSGHAAGSRGGRRRTNRSPRAAGRARSPATPVSLDFQQADLRAVLRVFSEISGLNIVIDPAVQGTVDVALQRRAVGSGARHHPARQQARLPRRRHHRPHRAAERAVRRRVAAPQARRRAGALRRTAAC